MSYVELNLTGSKLGCGEGGCGACTVLLSRCIDQKSDQVEHRTVNGCLTLLCSVDGWHLTTVEGLGSASESNLHPIQSRFGEPSTISNYQIIHLKYRAKHLQSVRYPFINLSKHHQSVKYPLINLSRHPHQAYTY